MLKHKSQTSNSANNSAEQALFSAVSNNDLPGAQHALLAGANIRAQDDKGDSALHIAARMQAVDLVQFLITQGANPNADNQIGESPLDIANSQDEVTSAALLATLLRGGAYDCNAQQHPQAPQEIASKVFRTLKTGQADKALKKALFTFMRIYNTLEPEHCAHFIDSSVEQLDLSLSSDYQLSNFTLTDALVKQIGLAAPHITQINLSGCRGINTHLVDSLIRFCGVTQIQLQSTQAIESGLIKEADLLQLNSLQYNGVTLALTELTVGKIDFATYPITDLAKAISLNTTITHLCIWKSHFSKKAMRLLSNGLKHNHTITALRLESCTFAQGATKALAYLLNIHASLQHVLLHHCGLNAIAMHDFAKMLSLNSVLTSLSFFGNPLGDQGLQILAQGLTANQSLMHV